MRQSEHANPLTMVLLAIPALLILGAMKGCEMVQGVTADVAPVEAVKPAPEPHYTIDVPAGWRI
jgi:hypothetical protein